jgi:hypothetical protein
VCLQYCINNLFCNECLLHNGDSEIPEAEAIKNQLGINIAYTTLHTEIILLLTKMIDYGL